MSAQQPAPHAAAVWLARDLQVRAQLMEAAAGRVASFVATRVPSERLRVVAERCLEVHVKAPAAALTSLAQLVRDT